MKETKVYVDELPGICDECPFQNKTTYECVLLPKYNKQPFLQSCPLKSLHEHDKELVAKVLESVKNEAYKDGFYDEDGNKIITYHINNYILDQIQKEFEK